MPSYPKSATLWIAISALGAACSEHESSPLDSSLDGGPPLIDAAPTSDGRVGIDAGPTLEDAAASPDAHGGGASCDLSGVWIGRMNTESLALGVPQYANNYYYYEFTQQGDVLTVMRHIDCGIEVLGSVKVVLSSATTAALSKRNLQTGRKATVSSDGHGNCDLSMEKFWSVRGVSEQTYAPFPRNSDVSLTSLQASNPLPASNMPGLTEDWDGDGKPGIEWVVTGVVSGTRDVAQRDWTRYFTASGYRIAAASGFGDLIIRAEFDGEEVVYRADLGLNQLSKPVAAAEHTLTLRFLGRTRDDARALAVIASDDQATCANVRQALPATQGLR